MDELIERVCARTGLPEEQSRQAAQAAVDFIKEKLPEPLRGQLDAVLANQNLGGVADQAMDMIGGMFNKK